MSMEVCAHCVFGRSIWPSLISAVSTLALFVAANWELATTEYFLIHSPRKMMPSVMVNVVYALVLVGSPLVALLASLRGVLRTRAVKQSIQKREKRGNNATQPRVTQPRVIQPRSVSILCVCPLFLEVLLLDPIPEDLLHDLSAKHYEVLLEYPVPFSPMELSAPAGEDTDTDAAANNPIPAAQPIKKTYLQLNDNIGVTLQERELLLALGLAPDYTQLRFLRSRSRFQTIITGMQAGGYGLSVLQRLSQHLAISPLEALVSFFSVIMLVQFLLELYASSHYQRALLLRLNYHQFQRFLTARRSPLLQSYLTHFKYAHYVVGAVYFVLPGALSVYYAVHYIPSCLLCSATALLFSILVLLVPYILIIIVAEFPLFKAPTRRYNWFLIPVMLWLIATVGIVVLTLVSTTRHWELFHSSGNNSFSWIVPHVSTLT